MCWVPSFTVGSTGEHKSTGYPILQLDQLENTRVLGIQFYSWMNWRAARVLGTHFCSWIIWRAARVLGTHFCSWRAPVAGYKLSDFWGRKWITVNLSNSTLILHLFHMMTCPWLCYNAWKNQTTQFFKLNIQTRCHKQIGWVLVKGLSSHILFVGI